MDRAGLRRERAGFDVRDVHNSHYGRICPIETPEGPNIGLIGRLASFARVNEFGFLETPYRKVFNKMEPTDENLVGRMVREDVVDAKGKVVAKAGERITDAAFKTIKGLKKEIESVAINPFVSDQVDYLSADTEDNFNIAQANTEIDENFEFVNERVSSRYQSDFITSDPSRIDYIDVAPHQIVGISAALIPFLEHDDANRALMGSNMMAQAVPLVVPDLPIVSTGLEGYAAKDSGQVVTAVEDGEILSVTGNQISVKTSNGTKQYLLKKYQRSNQSTCIDQRPVVTKGQRIKAGDVIADSSSTVNGKLALGQIS